MQKKLFVALLGAAFSGTTVSAHGLAPIHQPTLTPQDSGPSDWYEQIAES